MLPIRIPHKFWCVDMKERYDGLTSLAVCGPIEIIQWAGVGAAIEGG